MRNFYTVGERSISAEGLTEGVATRRQTGSGYANGTTFTTTDLTLSTSTTEGVHEGVFCCGFKILDELFDVLMRRRRSCRCDGVVELCVFAGNGVVDSKDWFDSFAYKED